MRQKLSQFMMGRYGSDTLSRHMIYLSIVLLMVQFFTRMRFLTFVVDLILVLVIIRTLSKNTYARYQENEKYLAMIQPFQKRINMTKRRLSDKEHRYYYCPNCKTVVRVPRGRGAIVITCPHCHTQFEKKS